MGVIDTLSAGFALINRRIWLIAIPVVIDVFLWIGPGLSMAGIANRFPDAWMSAAQQLSSQGLQSQVTDAELDQYRGEIRQYTDQLGAVNLFGLLALQTPSLLARGADGPAPLGTAAMISVDRLMVLIPAAVLLLGGSLLLASLFMTGIGICVRGDQFRFALFARRSLVNWGRLTLFYLIVIFLAVLLGFPLGLVSLVLGAVFQPVGTVMMGLLLALGLWVGFYLFYSFAAIFVGDVNPLRAFWHSFNIVRHNLGSSLGLAILVVVIGEGTAMAWRLIFGQPFLVSVAILGNAYIGAGLTGASMIFYRERYALWQKKVRAGKKVVELND